LKPLLPILAIKWGGNSEGYLDSLPWKKIIGGLLPRIIMPNHIGEYSEDWMGAVVVQKTKQEVSIIF
jgi:hypothetical protein